MESLLLKCTIAPSDTPPSIYFRRGIARNASLKPRIACNDLGLGQREILHHPRRFRMLAILCVKPSVGSGVLVGIAEGQFIPIGSFFKKPKVWPMPMS